MCIRCILLLFTGIFASMTFYGQTSIKGRILGPDLKPVVGASVINKSTNLNVRTDKNGDYQIRANICDTLNFFSIGLSPESRIIEVLTKKCNIILIDKEVNCLGAIWDERDYKRAYRRVNNSYKKLNKLANTGELW